MLLLEERILRDGKIRNGGILKVDSFLNHQMDVALFRELALEWRRIFDGCEVTKILTIEASGIGLACIAAEVFRCPVIFAKKAKTKNIDGAVYTSEVESFTHCQVYEIVVAKEYLCPDDKVLILDDFLANGAALTGLVELVTKAGASLVGAGVAIEKVFQHGGDMLRARGIRVEALARIKSMNEESGIEFC